MTEQGEKYQVSAKMNNYYLVLFQDRIKVTKAVLDEFNAALVAWRAIPPSDKEIMAWVGKLDNLGLADWLAIGGIDDLRADAEAVRGQ